MKPTSKVTPVLGRGASTSKLVSKVLKKKTPAKVSRRCLEVNTPPTSTTSVAIAKLKSMGKKKKFSRTDPEIEEMLDEMGWQQDASDSGTDDDEQFINDTDTLQQEEDVMLSGGELDDELEEMLQNSEKKMKGAQARESLKSTSTDTAGGLPVSSKTSTPKSAAPPSRDQEEVEVIFQKSLENLADRVESEMRAMERRNEERYQNLVQMIEGATERILAARKTKLGVKDTDDTLLKPYKDAVHETYASLGPQMQYKDERFDSPHNMRVTRLIKETIADGMQELPDVSMIHRACRRRCESATRPKPTPAEKKEKNMATRRLKKLERRGKARMSAKEAWFWEGITADFMTDEEEGEDENQNKVFVERSLPWRSDTLNRFVKMLDERKPPVNVNVRRPGEPSERPAPPNCPAKFRVQED